MSNYKFETLQLHAGQEQPDIASDARAVPIYATTSYVFHNSQHAADRFALKDAGNIYGRLNNSTQGAFEKRIAALEGGVAALAVASGAAAITYTIQALAQKGDHIVSQKTVYGGTFNLLNSTLPQFDVETTFVDAHNLEEVEGAIREVALIQRMVRMIRQRRMIDLINLWVISKIFHYFGSILRMPFEPQRQCLCSLKQQESSERGYACALVAQKDRSYISHKCCRSYSISK